MSNKEKTHLASLDEIKRLAEKADKNKGFEFGIKDDFVEDIEKIDFVNDTQNPDESHKYYYAIEGITRTYLPKGENAKEIRKYVREEKNIFLNRGKRLDDKGIRGSDSRMSYIQSHLIVAYEAVEDWAKNGGGTFEYFMIFRDLNIKFGYMEEKDKGEYDQTLSSFNRKLDKALKFNPKNKDKKDD